MRTDSPLAPCLANRPTEDGPPPPDPKGGRGSDPPKPKPKDD
jgi:hypothetical protein